MIPYKAFKHAKLNLKNVGQSMGEAKKDTVQKTKTYFDPKGPVFEKADSRDINNLYTGYKLGGKGRIGASVGMLGTGSVMVGFGPELRNKKMNQAIVDQQSQEQDIQSLPSTRGDMRGYMAQGGMGSTPDLTTSGDLVFAMHKTRHSGQF